MAEFRQDRVPLEILDTRYSSVCTTISSTSATWTAAETSRTRGGAGNNGTCSRSMPAPASDLFVSVYNDQQHFSYLDGSGNIQDAWWGGEQWHLQQINAGAGPTA